MQIQCSYLALHLFSGTLTLFMLGIYLMFVHPDVRATFRRARKFFRRLRKMRRTGFCPCAECEERRKRMKWEGYYEI